jgi:V-ATPase subunit C
VRMSEYNQLKGQITAINRKQMGSLAVRDLGGLLRDQDFVDTENLITVLVVVPRSLQREYLSTYETLTEFVVRHCNPPPSALHISSTLFLPVPRGSAVVVRNSSLPISRPPPYLDQGSVFVLAPHSSQHYCCT